MDPEVSKPDDSPKVPPSDASGVSSSEATSSETRIVPRPESQPPANAQTPAPIPPRSNSDSFSDETVLFSGVNRTSRFGRYVIEGVLGMGGFGTVFRALDEQLKRPVAVKVPHAHRMTNEAQKSLYLAEAQTLASLDHPRVVPIYDYGVLDDGRCYVVSKLIDGRSLSQVIAESPLSWEVAVPLLISLAETMHYVHSCKLIHRDIKPGNLLQDREGRIYVADFGLAMHETHAESHQAGAGTLNYMSPEQAGGEGHRIDSRSDLFSLGAVMYEMLTGVKPFKGSGTTSTLENVITKDPQPLTSINPTIPVELNRICLKLLSKRAADRYQTGQELADDLRYFEDQIGGGVAAARKPGTSSATQPNEAPEVMPRGLRSYDGQHAYFFLQLLPGPRDRNGLPESLSHWVRWVQRGTEHPELHRIGVIAGPSGCGKSSLVKAGLIPLLAKQSISTVMVEASIDRTESQLASALNSRFPELHTEKSLTDKIAAVRRGQILPAGKELLIVIDQFEQWLHSNQDQEHSDLIRALRQCDGQRVQCIVLVRDDFWLALNRFMESVEAPLVVGENVTMVDLFDLPHAAEVLTKFGRAFGRIPKDTTSISPATQEFIRQSIDYVAHDGKVFPVHLSLFGEMVKSRDWVPETLRELGGAVGMGLQFLRESFSVAHAPAAQRLHEEAVRKTLESLLPDVGTEIKTQWRTRDQLVEVSGYRDDPKSFESLMKILEGDLKLISPIDTLEKSRSSHEIRNTEARYQLSHDFLVPSIREWLYSEQRKSVRGRCQLLLTEQTSTWSKQPVNRNLPLWSDWVMYRSLLSHSRMNESEKRMLRAADKYRGLQTLAGIVIAVAGFLGFQFYRNSNAAHALTQQLATTDYASAIPIIDNLVQHGWFARRTVNSALLGGDGETDRAVRLRLAEVRWNSQAVEPLVELALAGGTDEIEAVNQVREAVLPHRDLSRDACWKAAEDGMREGASEEQKQRAFRSLLLLVKLDPPLPNDPQARWQQPIQFIIQRVLEWIPSHPEQFTALVEGLTPVADRVCGEFHSMKLLEEQVENERSRWAALFLKELLQDPKQRTLSAIGSAPWLWKYMPPTQDFASPRVLHEVVDSPISDPADLQAARKVATAAAILFASEPNFSRWDLLKRSAHPSVRSLLIQRLPMLGVPLGRIEDQFRSESDSGVLSALAMAMGGYPDASTAFQESTKQRIRQLYETDNDSGVHSACEWLMKKTNIPLTPETIQSSSLVAKSGAQWRLTPEGHLMVRFDARHVPAIGRVFEIAAKEVSVAQYQKYFPNEWYAQHYSPTPDCPINVVRWTEAIRYCDRLSRDHGIASEQFFSPLNARDEANELPLLDFLPGPADLNRAGYRLPTSAEWEFACRAGTVAEWSFGSHPELMKKFAVYQDQLDHYCFPCGSRLPNDAGLFDMYGNLVEWCADAVQTDTQKRIVRGGSCTSALGGLATDDEGTSQANEDYNSFGFRIARTVTE